MRQALTDLSAEQLLASPKPYIAMSHVLRGGIY
jgi:hypothetical protein